MKKRYLTISLVAILVAVIFCCSGIQRTHTFMLAGGNTATKSEQIQPVFGTVKVSSDCDTDVIFTDIETGEKHIIGYLTSGATETIKLQRNKWYMVSGGGNITVKLVNVRVS
jgi:hypothetical protein